jgi:hypothetical protein
VIASEDAHADHCHGDRIFSLQEGLHSGQVASSNKLTHCVILRLSDWNPSVED